MIISCLNVINEFESSINSDSIQIKTDWTINLIKIKKVIFYKKFYIPFYYFIIKIKTLISLNNFVSGI